MIQYNKDREWERENKEYRGCSKENGKAKAMAKCKTGKCGCRTRIISRTTVNKK